MIQIGILGCGTVASGTIRILTENRAEIAKRIGEEVVIKKVLARTPEKARRLGLSEAQIVSSIDEIALDPDISIVAELIGGTGDAYTFLRRCMENGKHIVTANKDLLALRWDELTALAQEKQVDLLFEASVAGGIPILAPIRQTLCANNITGVAGILNGTSNYILSKMSEEGASYADALLTAQQLGYAEANPAADVGGLDAARKLVILACLAFHARFTLEDVQLEGITGVTPADIAYAARLGCVIKLLGVGRQTGDRASLCVRPALIPKSHPLSAVSGAANGVFVSCDAAGELFFSGSGAGALPTGSSVTGDILEICRNLRVDAHARFLPECYREKPIVLTAAEDARFLLILDSDLSAEEAANALRCQNIAIDSAETAEDGKLLLISAPVAEPALENALSALASAQQLRAHRRYLLPYSEAIGVK